MPGGTFMIRRFLFTAGTCLILSVYTTGVYAAPNSHTLWLHATTDFPDYENGEAPFYKDLRRGVMAINAANRDFQEKWATAKTTSPFDSGIYDLTITTMVEMDGEPTYRVLINDEIIGHFTNPETTQNYKIVSHTWPRVQINQGDTLTVEARAHTNGRFSARIGTTWARGCWRSLALTPSN